MRAATNSSTKKQDLEGFRYYKINIINFYKASTATLTFDISLHEVEVELSILNLVFHELPRSNLVLAELAIPTKKYRFTKRMHSIKTSIRNKLILKYLFELFFIKTDSQKQYLMFIDSNKNPFLILLDEMVCLGMIKL